MHLRCKLLLANGMRSKPIAIALYRERANGANAVPDMSPKSQRHFREAACTEQLLLLGTPAVISSILRPTTKGGKHLRRRRWLLLARELR
jgi:hypothetical protein